MKFNINITHGSDANLTISISDVVFKNIANYYQAVAAINVNNNDGDSGFARPNEDTITVSHVTPSTSTGVSGDVELESKPTWAY